MFETKESSHGLDEKMQKKLIRQLRAIRFWLSFFGLIMLIGFGLLGFLLYKVVSTINTVEKKFTNLQSQTVQTLNVKDDICANSLAAGTSFCKQ